MMLSPSRTAVVVLLTLIQALASQASSSHPHPRGLPNAPDGYAPSPVDCPVDRPAIRNGSSLSPNETQWLQNRRPIALSAMEEFLERANITGFDARTYFNEHLQNDSSLPTIGLAVSGGGYRALLYGAGVLAAFDNRTDGSTSPGHLGGLLQASTYVSGLSGGAWLVGSIYVNNFTTIPALLGDSSPGGVWDFNRSILVGPEDQPDYFQDLRDSVISKRDAGFEVSITDAWARALSCQLIDGDDCGISYTWSSLALQSGFQDGLMPLPIVTALERAPNNRNQLIASNATSFEFNPWEMGSFDPTTNGFAPLEYIGSNFSDGTLAEDQDCVRGFDNAGFVMGTSSSIFNQVLIEVRNFETNNAILRNLTATLTNILTNISEANLDIAIYRPNPFFGYEPETNHNADTMDLHLVDAALDLQNLPLPPLLVPARAVDVVFAIDSSADTGTNWPNGASMVATYERYIDPSSDVVANGTSFPSIPDTNTFVNLGLNAHPTFFGCNASNMTGPNPGPIVVYIPQGPYSFLSNVSTFELTYNASTRNAIVQNGYNVATLANGTLHDEHASSWPACLGCAVLGRSFDRTGTEMPAQCRECFERYCWDGTVNSTTPAPFDPRLALATDDKEENGAATTRLVSIWHTAGLLLGFHLLLFMFS